MIEKLVLGGTGTGDLLILSLMRSKPLHHQVTLVIMRGRALLILDSRFWEGKTHIWGGKFHAFFNVFCILGVFLGGFGILGGNPCQEIAGNNTGGRVSLFKNVQNKTLSSSLLFSVGYVALGNLTFDDIPMIGELELEHKELQPGGRWFPKTCIRRHNIAVIVPFRDREEHLRFLLSILHPMLQRQMLQYTIFVIEQVCEIRNWAGLWYS